MSKATISIIFTKEVLDEMALTEALPEGFTGPTFEEVSALIIENGVAQVHAEDGTIYVYPLTGIRRIKRTA